MQAINKTNIILILLLTTAVIKTFAQPEKDSELKKANMDSLLAYHFRNLDSTVASNKADTVFYCCPYSIEVIEKTSQIYSRADINFAGKWKFYLSDWIRWHEWYKSKLELNLKGQIRN